MIRRADCFESRKLRHAVIAAIDFLMTGSYAEVYFRDAIFRGDPTEIWTAAAYVESARTYE
jgi:hypothetical protein